MSQIILSNVKLWVGAHDMSGKLNSIALNDTPDILDNTTMGNTAKSRMKGLDIITADLEGFWEQEPDEYFSTLGLFQITGTATGGSATTLIDTTKNFMEEGIILGSTVINVTDGGQTQPAGVTSFSTTTNPNDTLNFAALLGGTSFGAAHDYKIIVQGIPMTIAPTPTEGGPAYCFLSQNIEYSTGGNVGELLKFSVKSESVGKKMIRGKILLNGSKSVSGNGTAFEYTGVTTTQYLYGVLYVTSAITAVGDTLAIIVESDHDNAFSGSESTRITFTTVLGNGGGIYQWAIPLLGAPITDTWWRAKYTIVETDDAHFTFVVFMGIA